jgi:hypothetical protein
MFGESPFYWSDAGAISLFLSLMSLPRGGRTEEKNLVQSRQNINAQYRTDQRIIEKRGFELTQGNGNTEWKLDGKKAPASGHKVDCGYKRCIITDWSHKPSKFPLPSCPADVTTSADCDHNPRPPTKSPGLQ